MAGWSTDSTADSVADKSDLLNNRLLPTTACGAAFGQQRFTDRLVPGRMKFRAFTMLPMVHSTINFIKVAL